MCGASRRTVTRGVAAAQCHVVYSRCGFAAPAYKANSTFSPSQAPSVMRGASRRAVYWDKFKDFI
jgi:hypothetical protein